MSTQQIKTKSISKFPSLDSVQNSDLFLVSRAEANGYSSHSTQLSTIVSFANDQISSAIQAQFGMAGMKVDAINDKVNEILSGNITLSAQKTFTALPLITGDIESDDINDNNLVTKKLASNIVNNSGLYIGPNSKTSASPNNCAGYTNNDDSLMTWRIETGKSESKSTQTCGTTGQLVVYGWLQDSGGVLAQEAWVALCGEIKNGNRTPTWTVLQLQPWPVTARSGILQYIGFNIPVQKNLKLKIRTGFKVNQTASATQSGGNSMTFNTTMANCFVGYIIGD